MESIDCKLEVKGRVPETNPQRDGSTLVDGNVPNYTVKGRVPETTPQRDRPTLVDGNVPYLIIKGDYQS